MSGYTRVRMPAPLVTFTLFGFAPSRRAWAFTRMGLARPGLARVEGLRFWRLLGSGHGSGFSLRPDWSRYGLLAVWESPADAEAFFADAPVARGYRANAEEVWTVRMRPTSAHGAWSGANPFLPLAPGETPGDPSGDTRPVAVLTRASVRLSRAAAFWRAVPATGASLASAGGLIASIGVGEAPFVLQATISFWENDSAIRAFAYENGPHKDVVRRTRAERWYAEDLFARFRPVASEGTWSGRDPLEGRL